jgi:hypothetical protein
MAWRRSSAAAAPGESRRPVGCDRRAGADRADSGLSLGPVGGVSGGIEFGVTADGGSGHAGEAVLGTARGRLQRRSEGLTKVRIMYIMSNKGTAAQFCARWKGRTKMVL